MDQILTPLFVMAFLTLIVATVMYFRRVSYMKSNRIHPDKVKLRSGGMDHLKDSRAADNYANLFEAPVLFYLAILIAYVTKTTSLLVLSLAWAYVVFRIGHSVVHCTYNKVMHRFAAFILSMITLMGLWIVITLRLIFGINF